MSLFSSLSELSLSSISPTTLILVKYEVPLFSVLYVLFSLFPKIAFALARYVLLLSSLSNTELTLYSVSVVFSKIAFALERYVLSWFPVVFPNIPFALARYVLLLSSLSRIEVVLFSVSVTLFILVK